MALSPVVITAHLLRGVCADEHDLDLAGLLAAQMHRSLDLPLDEDYDLPLDVCLEDGDDWHWLATNASFAPLDDRYPYETRTLYRQVDTGWTQRSAVRPLPYTSPRSGPFRDVMMPASVVLTPSATWYAVGDIERMRALLSPVRAIGKRRARGEGTVLSWDFEQTDTDSKWVFGHTGNTGEIKRPCPQKCAERLDLPYDTKWHALRPPSWNPNRLRPLCVPPADEMYIPEEWEL